MVNLGLASSVYIKIVFPRSHPRDKDKDPSFSAKQTRVKDELAPGGQHVSQHVPRAAFSRKRSGEGIVDRVEIARRGETIAMHSCSYDTADFVLIFNLLHYLKLLERKSKALGAMDNWQLAEFIHRLRRLIEARMGNAGLREFIQVLRLMEDFHQHQIEQAVSDVLRLGAISFDALKMLLLARSENRSARLDLTYPYLPAVTVGTTDPRAYLGLIASLASILVTAEVLARQC